MEDEIASKTRKIENLLDKKLSSMVQDSDLCSNSMTKSEIKKYISEEKENILLEIKDAQRTAIKKEVKDEVELRDSEINGKLVELQKKVFIKIDTYAQENLEAFRFMNDRIKQYARTHNFIGKHFSDLTVRSRKSRQRLMKSPNGSNTKGCRNLLLATT